MAASRKVTLVLPEALLQKAQRASGQGITPTVRQALQLLAAREVYRRLRGFRGKVKLDLDLAELRRDR